MIAHTALGKERGGHGEKLPTKISQFWQNFPLCGTAVPAVLTYRAQIWHAVYAFRFIWIGILCFPRGAKNLQNIVIPTNFHILASLVPISLYWFGPYLVRDSRFTVCTDVTNFIWICLLCRPRDKKLHFGANFYIWGSCNKHPVPMKAKFVMLEYHTGTIFRLDCFYRMMHYSAKHGHEITCRLSVCPSICPLVDHDHIG